MHKQGFTNSVPIVQPRALQPLHLALISRLGWKRAGARFKTRGVDDQGNVANFVEVCSSVHLYICESKAADASLLGTIDRDGCVHHGQLYEFCTSPW
jgi:hypothetical protein